MKRGMGWEMWGAGRAIRTVLVIMGFVMPTLIRVTTAPAVERTWTRSEILAIADKEAQRLGYDSEHMSISFDIDNSQWKEYVAGISQSTVAAKLNGKSFIAVYYGPMKEQLGGDLWVFIDRSSGEVIETLRGK